jgi:holo-[acyl-carrier protein] synthase
VKILGHGVDIAPIARIEEMLREHPDRFVERCFTAREAAYARSSPGLASQRFAARFAAKEAAMKALGTGWNQGVQWKDLEIVNNPDGCPALRLAGGALSRAMQMGYRRVHVSLSHSRRTAIAQVILED